MLTNVCLCHCVSSLAIRERAKSSGMSCRTWSEQRGPYSQIAHIPWSSVAEFRGAADTVGYLTANCYLCRGRSGGIQGQFCVGTIPRWYFRSWKFCRGH